MLIVYCTYARGLFVSSENVSDIHIALLIDSVRGEGFRVMHSPLNPLEGNDPRWASWYNWDDWAALGLEMEIGHAEIFIVGVTAGWDCSTWMMMELDAARKQLESGRLKALLYYSPGIIPRAVPMVKRCLTNRLPDDLNAAMEIIRMPFDTIQSSVKTRQYLLENSES